MKLFFCFFGLFFGSVLSETGATKYDWQVFNEKKEIYLYPEKKRLVSGYLACKDHCGNRLRIYNAKEYQLLVEFMKQNNLTEVLSRTWAQTPDRYEFDPFQIWIPPQPDQFDFYNDTDRDIGYSVVWDSKLNYTMNDHEVNYKTTIICSRDVGTYCKFEHPDPLVPGKSGTWERYFGEKGQKFTGSVLRSEKNVSLVECMKQCFYDSRCFLVNYYHQQNTCEYLDWSDKSKVSSEETVAFELK